MNYKYYEKKINDILYKCNIESGIEIITYMLLDEIIENKNLSLVAIDSLQKTNRFLSEGGFSDLSIVSNDFLYDDPSKGKCYGCVEVKHIRKNLKSVRWQVIGQLITFNNILVTNGLDWEFYSLKKHHQQSNCNSEKIDMEKELQKVKELFVSYKKYNDELLKLKKLEDYEKNPDYILKNKELNNINNNLDNYNISKPVWTISLTQSRYTPYTIDNMQYIELLNKLNQIQWK